jgi:hypothetical protein
MMAATFEAAATPSSANRCIHRLLLETFSAIVGSVAEDRASKNKLEEPRRCCMKTHEVGSNLSNCGQPQQSKRREVGAWERGWNAAGPTQNKIA